MRPVRPPSWARLSCWERSVRCRFLTAAFADPGALGAGRLLIGGTVLPIPIARGCTGLRRTTAPTAGNLSLAEPLTPPGLVSTAPVQSGLDFVETR